MIRILSYLFIAFLALGAARADFGAGSNLTGFFGKQSAVACSSTPVTYLGTQSSATDADSYTFNGVAIGDVACAGNIRLIVTLGTCFSTTASSSSLELTINGNADTEVSEGVALQKRAFSATQIDTGTTADFVLTNTAAVDATCEAAALIIYSVITTTATRVDFVEDVNPTGDFDLSNVAVTAGGAEIVYMSANPANACGDLDATFGGTETVIVDINETLDSQITYTAGHFTADSTATGDDYVNISCGTETAGFAGAASWQPPA